MPKEKRCKDCAFCKQVYRKGGYGVFPDDVYLCMKKEEFTDKKGVCEIWQEKASEYDLSEERFQRAEEDISAIKQIIKNKKIPFVTLRSKRRRIST